MANASIFIEYFMSKSIDYTIFYTELYIFSLARGKSVPDPLTPVLINDK